MAENCERCHKCHTNGQTQGNMGDFFLSSFVVYFLIKKSAETPTRDLEFGREVAFPFVSSLLGNFAPAGLAMERVSTSVGDGAGEGAGNDVGNGAGNAVRSLPPPDT